MNDKTQERNASIDIGKYASIDIGKYRLSTGGEPGKVWITLIDDGEGMQTDEQKLEAVLDRFYEAEF